MIREWWLNFCTWMKTKNYCWWYKLFITVPLIAVLLAIDWSTKAWAVNHLDHSGMAQMGVPGFFYYKLIINQGSAYGAMADKPGVVITLASIITIVVFTLFVVSSNKMFIATFAVIFAGSFGNLLARAWAPNINGTHNGVVDFLVWDFWNAGTYIFNIADMIVNIGIGLAILSLILFIVAVVMDYVLKRRDEVAYEDVNDLREQICFLAGKIDRSFFTTRFSVWLQNAKLWRAEISDCKQKIHTIKKSVAASSATIKKERSAKKRILRGDE